MDSQTEQRLAKIYLEYYDEGDSILKYFLRQKLKYLFHITVMILTAYAAYILKDSLAKGLFIFIFGMFFGALARDYGWIRRINMNWPFSKKIIDWDIVRDLAEDQVR